MYACSLLSEGNGEWGQQSDAQRILIRPFKQAPAAGSEATHVFLPESVTICPLKVFSALHALAPPGSAADNYLLSALLRLSRNGTT